MAVFSYMNNNKVSITVDGEVFEFWESANISSELTTIAPSFSLAATFSLPQGKRTLATLAVGKRVQVKIGDDVVVTGYIDKTPVNYSASSVTISISGRSKTEDLVDCSVIPKDTSIDIDNSHKWGNFTEVVTGEVIQPPALTATHWSNTSMCKIIAQLAGSYGVKFVDQSGFDTVVKSFGTDGVDTVLKTLQNLTAKNKLIFCGDEYGNLVLVSVGYKKNGKPVENLILGQNILSCSANFDGSKLFSEYQVKAQENGTNSKGGQSLNSSANQINNFFDRVRLGVSKSSGSSTITTCQDQAEFKNDYNLAQFYKTSYTIQGWRRSDGNLWKINEFVNITDSFLGFKDNLMLITKVTFDLSNGEGMTTTLEVVPPAGAVDWLSTNNSAKQKETSKGKTSTLASNTNDLSWINA